MNRKKKPLKVRKSKLRVRITELFEAKKGMARKADGHAALAYYCRPHIVDRPREQAQILAYKWNKGACEPNLEDLLKIAEFFRVKDITKLIERV